MSPRTTQGNLEGGRGRSLLFRLLAGLLAGTVAIVANMVLLSFANNAGITTGNGGLLRLFATMIQCLAWCLHLVDGRSNLPLPSLAVFHIVTGLTMAAAYVLIIEPNLPGRPFSKGLVYGTIIWCFNAFLVLPLIGEGVAGSRNVKAVGQIVFAVAHMTFFLALSMLYETLCSIGGTERGM